MEHPLDDNISRQIEEQEALRSIYGEEWKEDVGGGSWCIALTEGSVTLELIITLTDVYPGQGPPLFRTSAPSLSRKDMVEISNILQDLYLDNIGETIIFQWIERARDWLQERVTPAPEANTSLARDEVSSDSSGDLEKIWHCKNNLEEDKATETKTNPEIVHGDPISFKKSTFQGHVSTVISTEQVKKALSSLMENKKIANATHNIYAYRIYREDTKSFSQDCNDDGEAQAGGRLLHLLQIMDVRNIFVVVSRWYGGVHLGPDRFRLINNAARQVIQKAGLISTQDNKKKH